MEVLQQFELLLKKQKTSHFLPALEQTHHFPPQDLDPLIGLHTRLCTEIKRSLRKHQAVDTHRYEELLKGTERESLGRAHLVVCMQTLTTAFWKALSGWTLNATAQSRCTTTFRTRQKSELLCHISQPGYDSDQHISQKKQGAIYQTSSLPINTLLCLEKCRLFHGIRTNDVECHKETTSLWSMLLWF